MKNEIKVGDCFRADEDEIFIVTDLSLDGAWPCAKGITVTSTGVQTGDGWTIKHLEHCSTINRSEFESAFAAIKNEVEEALKTK